MPVQITTCIEKALGDAEVPLAGEMKNQDEHDSDWELESSSSSRRSNDSNMTLLLQGSLVEQYEDEGLKDTETLLEGRSGEGRNDAAPDQQGINDHRLEDYPIPLVAQTVHLRNDDRSVE